MKEILNLYLNYVKVIGSMFYFQFYVGIILVGFVIEFVFSKVKRGI